MQTMESFYQAHNFTINGGQFIQGSKFESSGLAYLKANVASGAFHNSDQRFDPPKCHEGTRMAILKRITDWVGDLHTPRTPVMWLYGPAGAGKSAVVQTIADRVLPDHLAASFFFSRTATERNNEKRLIPTIAYQLTLSVPPIREFIVKAVEADPLIFSRSLETQLKTLITTPWTMISESTRLFPKLIAIDGLDECHGSDAQRAILEVLSATLIRNQLPFFFLITSRPEQAIRAAFKCDDLHKLSCRLILDDSFMPAKDIKLFLDDQFAEIKRTHLLKSLIPSSWPSQDAIQALVLKSSGQFIYASTVIKYVKSPKHRPSERLNIVQRISSANGDTPFAQLDALYKQILLSADDINCVLRILGVVLIWNDAMFVSLSGSGSNFVPTPQVVELLLWLKEGDVALALSDLHSILDVPELGTDQYRQSSIRILHASLSDFFADRLRSGELFIDLPRFHEDLARCCLKHASSTVIANPNVHVYSLFRLVGHIVQLPPTCELLNDLQSVNLAMILSKMVREKDHSLWKRNLLMWLSWSKMPEPSRLDLDAYILAQCDTFLKAELDKYPRSWALASLALLDLGGPLQRRISELHPNHSQDIRHLPLPLLQPYDLDNSNLPVKASCRSFSSYLHSLLGDAQRGGEYFLTGEVYNRVTVEYAKHVIGSRSILYDTLIIYEDLPRLLDEAALSRELLDCLPNLHSHLFPSMHEQFLAIESLIDNYLRKNNGSRLGRAIVRSRHSPERKRTRYGQHN